MIKILNKKFLFTIVIFSSCNQNIEPVNEIPIQNNPTEKLETQSTFVFDEIFIDESSLDEWTEFKLLKSDILDLSNSIQEYDSVIKFNQDVLNQLSNSSTEIFSSDFELYNENQKHIPNFWMYEWYDAFLIDKQLSIWRVAQNQCPFL